LGFPHFLQTLQVRAELWRQFIIAALYNLFDANHAKARAQTRCEFDGEMERLAGAIGAVVCNQDSLDQVILQRRRLRPA
jgi:hypothetical protein